MKLRILLAGLIAGIICGTAALAAETGQELFQKAYTQETAAGNLEEAIKLYQRVAKEFASDRALAAKALERAAECYEKFGKDQQDKAVQLYQRVASQYKDQTQPAATASARLAAIRQAERAAQPVAMTQRKIEIAGAVAEIYSDGQRAVYQDQASNALVVSDLAGKSKRVVYKLKPGESLSSYAYAPSRDFSMVYFRLIAQGGKVTHAVSKIDGTGFQELFQGYPYGANAPAWSWDNRYLLFPGVPPGPGTRTWAESGIAAGDGLVLVSVSDGKGREVLRRDEIVDRAAFSPDGRFIAFSEGAPGSWTGKTFVVPVQGGEPQLISSEASLLDWTRDGRYLAVSSIRSGSAALWLLPVKDGQSSGDQVFVRNGSFMTGDIFPNQALVYKSSSTGWLGATLAPLDSNGHLGAWKPLDLKISGNSGMGVMEWSPDSTQIAYPSAHADAGQLGSSLRLHNIVSGEDREVSRRGVQCFWEAHRPNLFCLEDRPAVVAVSVALDSGRAEELGPVPREPLEQFAREKGIEIVRGPYGLVRVVNLRDVEVRATREGDWKHLVSLNADQRDFHPAYSFDGRWIFYFDQDSAGKGILLRISSAGGQPERLGEFPAQYRSAAKFMHISPDGRNILLEGRTAASSGETWLLENFEPKAPAAR